MSGPGQPINPYYYFGIIRKITAAFGSLFNSITIIKYDTNGNELERTLCPITYAEKEKYVVRLNEDHALLNPIQISLPRMSFWLDGISYDRSRKQQSTLQLISSDNTTNQYVGIPYDLKYNLSIYTRTIEDGAQIIEQILPIFNPSFTLTLNVVPQLNISKDVPINLDSVSYSVEYEGDAEDLRRVEWDLSFTVKANLYGPVSPSNLIEKAIINILPNSLIAGSPDSPNQETVILMLQNTDGKSSGSYKAGEPIFQGGSSFETAPITGQVVAYDAINEKLYVSNLVTSAGTTNFAQNEFIIGTTSGASWNLASYYQTQITQARITVTPNPANSNGTSAYSYTTNIAEWPFT